MQQRRTPRRGGNRRLTAGTVLAALGLAACGSGDGLGTPTRSYRVALKGILGMSAPGVKPSGAATIRVFQSRRRLCWSFQEFVGVPHPTRAHLNVDLGHATEYGSVVVPFGQSYAPTGCSPVLAAGLVSQLVSTPEEFYVDVEDRPVATIGVIRGQL